MFSNHQINSGTLGADDQGQDISCKDRLTMIYYSAMPKWRSYPGDGHRNLQPPWTTQGSYASPEPIA